MKKPKVLFVAGWTRSGSTLLDSLMGSFEKFVAVGELHNIFDADLSKRHPCGCGRPVEECELWGPVLRRAFGDAWSAEAARMRASRAAWDHVQNTQKILRGQDKGGQVAFYIQGVERLYGAIAEETGARVIVDSSKRPQVAALLLRLQGIDPYLVQLIRDPRAVAFSWARSRDELVKHGSLYSSTRWVMRNTAADRVRAAYGEKGCLLRYEDLTAEPRKHVRGLLRLIDEDPEGDPFIGERTAEMQANHVVSGNPVRHRRGPVEIKEDAEWRSQLPWAPRLASTVVTSPWLRRYGYRLRSQAPAAR